MFGTHDLAIFVAAVMVLNMTPGPDAMYVLGRSVTQGRRAGMLSSLGTVSGAGVHVVAAALGLSAFLATSAHAFTVVKWAGVVYLVYLGIRTFFDKSGLASPATADASGASGSTVVKHRSDWTLFWQGVLTDVLNPKVALFFLAFLPQFIDPTAPNKVLAFLFLGSIVVGTGLIWDMGLAVFASHVTKMLRGNKGFARMANRVMGVVLVGLGIRLAQQEM
jgi:RhtB (resistance to homoserine/threonine) family protein